MSALEITNIILLALNLVFFIGTNVYIKSVNEWCETIEKLYQTTEGHFDIVAKQYETMRKYFDIVRKETK